MGFTVRFILGTVLVLLCSWPIQTTELNRPIPVSDNEGEKLQETENQTQQSIVANLTEEHNEKPKTDLSTEDNKTIDKQNSVVGKLEGPESASKPTSPEIGRSIDIEKYVSKEFHSKNNVYALPISPDTKKYIDPEYDFHATTHKHLDHSDEFDFNVELTTPKSAIFDQKFKEAVASLDQKLEHIDESHELSSESESKEINLEKLFDETLKNDTKANLTYVNYKNILSNDTGGNNSLHKDLLVEAGTNLDFRSSYNHTTIIDEDDQGNNTIIKEPESNDTKRETSTLSNVIPDKGDAESAESLATKIIIPTTRKSIVLTKPPSSRNSSHISILSNNIETETVKAINPLSTTEKPKGDMEVVSEVFSKKTPVDVSKRFFMLTDISTESTVDTNHIGKKSEQLLQENQVIPVHVEAPPKMKNNFTTEEVSEVENVTESMLSKKQTTERLDPQITTTVETTAATTVHQIEVLLTSTTAKAEIAVTERNGSETTTYSPEVTTVESTMPSVETTTALETVVTVTPSEIDEFTTDASKTTTVLVTEQTTSAESDRFTTDASKTEIETVTSIVTETSVSPWERVTTQSMDSRTTPLQPTTTLEPEIQTVAKEVETTMFLSTYLSDSTAPTVTTELPITTEAATVETVPTTEAVSKISESQTENTVRSSKGMVFSDSTPVSVTTEMATETITEISTTESPETSTIELTTTEATVETTLHIEGKVTENLETTTMGFVPRRVPDVKTQTESSTETDNTTDSNTMTSDSYEYTDSPEDNGGVIAAITISSIAAVCLVLLAGLFVIMRKRQKRFNYGQRCTPVSLDDYSMDNVSVYNSVRRKGMTRGSKRSYGNPAFEDPASVSHPLNFPALGKFANNLEDIRAEFEDIPQITARTNELPEGCDTKNRYANVIPLPETRVFLKPIDGYPNSDYINANYVTGPKNTKGYYIACQAPMQNTVDDFWRMIWEQQSKVILMLTHLFENGVEKCVDYLPPSEVLDCHRLFGDFQVTLKKREVKDKYIISSLQLKNMVSNSWREITHFWYLGWPEKGVPSEANSLIAFLIEARSYMKSSSIDRKDVTNGNLTNGIAKNELNPVVVHCSPGTGRTGVVIACDIAIREFEQTRLVDVPRIVYKIRRDRASAVQTKEQYAFIYKVINLYATKLTGGALDSL